MKWKTFGKVLETIAAVAVPHGAEVIGLAHQIADSRGADRQAAILAEIDASLVAAGDLSGKQVLAQPDIRALAGKYAEDGLALHELIERRKKALLAPKTGAELGVPAGSTGE